MATPESSMYVSTSAIQNNSNNNIILLPYFKLKMCTNHIQMNKNKILSHHKRKTKISLHLFNKKT